MTTSALRRQVKNIVHNYSEAEIKVREATSNDPWGPPSSLMSEIADLTFNTVAFAEVMGMIWRRLNDSGKNWRHVYKALTLLDYLIKTGSEKVTHQCRENLYTIQTLKDFQYVDRDGKDQGINIREKVKQVMALLKDEERLKQERAHALQTKERMALEGMGSGSHQVTYGRRASPYGDDYGRARGSPSSFNCECRWRGPGGSLAGLGPRSGLLQGGSRGCSWWAPTRCPSLPSAFCGGGGEARLHLVPEAGVWLGQWWLLVVSRALNPRLVRGREL